MHQALRLRRRDSHSPAAPTTTDPANASHDGQGNLVIRALKRGGAITSARLITKARFAFLRAHTS